ncbi:MAG: serine/threonine dehydratase [Candidatus Thermofonsia Clade 1 bacterium]|uniref:threonine ammonia-lyase n=1 Tax=Candidatus Thermofonsia Clade 1 bacterium TaxID=2364210 RepID=A0A2M8PCX2_9CHLR|nr:MAG: serine/threonine dehydratase [Candidatus Thermofonsia Clade 1 bacterium]RMF54193.1 MAG: threonine/serine dehydratase [Chloroflexota bacterium]
MIELKDIVLARERIAPYVRRTPLLQAKALQKAPSGRLWLKLEQLQVSGSFKARGAINKLLSMPGETLRRGIVTASGGNHGLAVAYAGWLASTPTYVYLPHNTPPHKAQKLRAWRAEVIMHGEVWDDANAAALERAEREGMTYIHPFADPAVIAGQGSIALEVLEDLPQVDTILVAIGGGGLISGVALAAKALKPAVRLIGVEPVGAPTLKASLAANAVIALPHIATRANTLAPRQSAPINLEIIRQNVDEIVLVSDEAMLEAARWLWFELGIAAELSGAAATAAVLSGAIVTQPEETLCALVCGAGTDGIDFA